MKKSFKSAMSFFSESWSELRKVKWPGRKELTSYTIVVMGTVIGVGLYFTVLDVIISHLVELVIR
ncbi:preprotein translocase subunit SecE [Gorillibacterium massiliense]|uniref:preprotein translocase subunit SecE n=1 Tax=Gorillibacterium massiliense TaxID=1280390 RepID=UPI00059500CE|nr:preprotein translocase subunit SecE [Gorillibacterium massiliense]